MKYLVLVSHGEFANGLKNALFMLSGEREDVISTGLLNGLSADEFALVFEKAIEKITEDDSIVLLADIIGGSPLTTAMNVLAEKGMIDNCTVIGGMNLPLALTTALMKDQMDGDMLVNTVLGEARDGLKQFVIEDDDDDDDDL